jgi:CO/xanthine dehydrogenase FAD-binding subunit
MDLNTITEVARPRQRGELPAWRDGDAWLGGGTWLFSEPQVRLKRLIDVAALGWPALRVSPIGLEIAATCTIAELNAAVLPVEWIAAPLIDRCCRSFLASFKIWNTATVGSERKVPVADFVTGPQQNGLKPGELLRRIDIPASALIRRAASRQISLARIGRSGALLIGTLDPPTGEFVLTVTASTPRPIKFSFNALPSAEDLRARIEREIPAGAYYNDIHGLPAWRRHMTLYFAQEIRDELARTSR